MAMQNGVSKTTVGAFVVGAAALAVIAVLALGSGHLFHRSVRYTLYFRGSVTGLQIGAPVTFRGVQVGSVVDYKLRSEGADAELRIPVFIEIDPDRVAEPRGTGQQRVRTEADMRTRVAALIARGLRARLELQSIVTGQLLVAFDLYPDKPAVYLGFEPEYPELPTITSGFEEISEALGKVPLEHIANKLVASLDGIEHIINSTEVRGTLTAVHDSAQAVKVIAQDLGQRAQTLLDDMRSLVRRADEKVGPVSASIEAAAKETGQLVRDMDERVATLTTTLDQVARDARELTRKIDAHGDPLATSLHELSESARASLARASDALGPLDATAAPQSPFMYQLRDALKSFGQAMDSFNALATYISQHPEALVKGKPGP
ncbi:MAG: MlaD family protein [Planctomycetota bacterium]